MRRNQREERIGSKHLPRIVIITASLLLVIAGSILWNIITALPSPRTTVVQDGNPIQIVSWDESRRKLTVIALPRDVYVNGSRGVGILPIQSLQLLEELDKTKKGVFVRSLEANFAVPIAGVLGDLPLPLRIRMQWILARTRLDAIQSIDPGLQGVFRAYTLADGSRVRLFDVDRFDAIIGNRLEVDAIRAQTVRVRVVNTTGEAGLGSRAARMLSHAGMVVVAVQSDRTEQKRCTANAGKTLWNSPTGRFIQNVFRCSMAEEEEVDERFDVTVRLGTDYIQDGF